MGRLIFVVAKSGTGKSSSLRNLDPETSWIINSDEKPLPFRKFAEKYNEEKGNYLQSSDEQEIIAKIRAAHKDTTVKSLVIDTFSRVMTDITTSPNFRAAKGFEKWNSMTGSVIDIITIINKKVRNDLNVYLTVHPETITDNAGYTTEVIATPGQALKKLSLESFSTIVLYADVLVTPGQPPEYVFHTVNGGNNTCKTPMEMFATPTIPNDLVLVNKAIEEYY